MTVHIDPARPDRVVHQASACVFAQAPSPKLPSRPQRDGSGRWEDGPSNGKSGARLSHASNTRIRHGRGTAPGPSSILWQCAFTRLRAALPAANTRPTIPIGPAGTNAENERKRLLQPAQARGQPSSRTDRLKVDLTFPQCALSTTNPLQAAGKLPPLTQRLLVQPGVSRKLHEPALDSFELSLHLTSSLLMKGLPHSLARNPDIGRAANDHQRNDDRRPHREAVRARDRQRPVVAPPATAAAPSS